jgi:hypothetical protein
LFSELYVLFGGHLKVYKNLKNTANFFLKINSLRYLLATGLNFVWLTKRLKIYVKNASINMEKGD